MKARTKAKSTTPMTMPIMDDERSPISALILTVGREVDEVGGVCKSDMWFIDVVGVCEINGDAVSDMQMTLVNLGFEVVFVGIGITIVVTRVVTIVVREVEFVL